MKQLQNNPPLSLNSIDDLIKKPKAELIVSVNLLYIANKLFAHFIMNKFKFKLNGEDIPPEVAVEKHFVEFTVVGKNSFKDNEFILITEDEIYYSKGDSSS